MREELPVEAPPEGRIAFLRTPVGFLAVSIILLLAAYSALVIAWQWQKPTRKLMRGGAQVRLSMQGNAASVSFPPREIHQSELLLLKELPDLRMLEFRGSRISDDELIRALDQAPQITIVRLQETVCSPELVAALMERSRLRRLIFDRCSIEDVDHFADLASRQRREEISLTAVPMTLTQYEKLAPQPGVKLDIPAADLMRAGPSLRVEWLDPLRVRFKLFSSSDVTAADLQAVEFPERVSLIACGGAFWTNSRSFGELAPEAFEALARFTELRGLGLKQPVNDEQLAAIGALHKLQGLSIQGGQFTDDGLAAVRKLQELRFLSLSSPHVRGPGIDVIRSFKRLEKIMQLEFPNCDPSAFAAPANLPRLEWLSLPQQRLTDASLGFLTGCPELRYAQLRTNNLTPAALPLLAGLPELRSCDLEGNPIPTADREAFEAMLSERPRPPLVHGKESVWRDLDYFALPESPSPSADGL